MDKCYSVAKAVSGIDDRFLEEAENVQKQSKRLTLRPVFSLAACIVLVLGLTLLWPRPLKLTVNGKNLLRTAVSYSQDAAPMALRAVQTLDVPLTLNPGRGGSVTLTAENCELGDPNQAVATALEALHSQYKFVAYTTGTGTNQLHLKGKAQNATWKLKYGESIYTYSVSPFFANAMSLDGTYLDMGYWGTTVPTGNPKPGEKQSRKHPPNLPGVFRVGREYGAWDIPLHGRWLLSFIGEMIITHNQMIVNHYLYDFR